MPRACEMRPISRDNDHFDCDVKTPFFEESDEILRRRLIVARPQHPWACGGGAGKGVSPVTWAIINILREGL